ncbi:MAG: hypothetical protein KF819_01515 [Labilithrix sp.]|nr:hypothetical protein [Labilithrix sp.]
MAKDDEIVLPKKGKAKPSSSKTAVSSQMRKLMLVNRAVGIAFGGFVTLIGVMALVGLVTDNGWVRLLVGLVAVIVLPAFLADRVLRRTEGKGGLGLIADMFAIVLLGVALILVAAEPVTRSLFRHEGDLYAQSGSTFMARTAYFLGGVSPVFPSEKAAPAGSASASASASASSSGGK